MCKILDVNTLPAFTFIVRGFQFFPVPFCSTLFAFIPRELNETSSCASKSNVLPITDLAKQRNIWHRPCQTVYDGKIFTLVKNSDNLNHPCTHSSDYLTLYQILCLCKLNKRLSSSEFWFAFRFHARLDADLG